MFQAKITNFGIELSQFSSNMLFLGFIQVTPWSDSIFVKNDEIHVFGENGVN